MQTLKTNAYESIELVRLVSGKHSNVSFNDSDVNSSNAHYCITS
jgi:hypothetical protein